MAEPGTRRIRLLVEYDGTGLCGWQRQDNGPTVQGHLEQALAELLGTKTGTTGASRTDAGVHALGQVVHFDTAHPTIPPHGIRKALNTALPDQIAIIEAVQVADDFHARFDSHGKHYRYRVLSRPSRSGLDRHRNWHVDYPLDTSAMRAAAAQLVGEHDFTSFRAAGCTAKTATRKVTAIDIKDQGERIVVHVRGNAFLRNMVRIIAGTLVEVGAGRRAPDSLAELIAARDRPRAGRTAPAAGLTLMRVFYPGDPPG